MLSPLNAERLIGATIAIVGFSYAWHAYTSFDLGTMRRIGPGMFPVGLGAAMMMLGLGIAIMTPDADRDTPDFAPIPLMLVLAGIASFALGLVFLGLFPAIVLCVLVSSLANRPFKPVGAAATAAVLCVFGWLIFRVGLGLTLPLIRVPF